MFLCNCLASLNQCLSLLWSTPSPSSLSSQGWEVYYSHTYSQYNAQKGILVTHLASLYIKIFPTWVEDQWWTMSLRCPKRHNEIYRWLFILFIDCGGVLLVSYSVSLRDLQSSILYCQRNIIRKAYCEYIVLPLLQESLQFSLIMHIYSWNAQCISHLIRYISLNQVWCSLQNILFYHTVQ